MARLSPLDIDAYCTVSEVEPMIRVQDNRPLRVRLEDRKRALVEELSGVEKALHLLEKNMEISDLLDVLKSIGEKID